MFRPIVLLYFYLPYFTVLLNAQRYTYLYTYVPKINGTNKNDKYELSFCSTYIVACITLTVLIIQNLGLLCCLSKLTAVIIKYDYIINLINCTVNIKSIQINSWVDVSFD